MSGLTEGKTYYFSAFPYSSQGVYNLSSNEKNRASAAPADGETANVTINIDDDSAFNSVTITCVDETDGQYTKTATLTKTQKKASFTVPIGHTYHIEYGAEDGYSKPENTEAKVSVAGAVSTMKQPTTISPPPLMSPTRQERPVPAPSMARPIPQPAPAAGISSRYTRSAHGL